MVNDGLQFWDGGGLPIFLVCQRACWGHFPYQRLEVGRTGIPRKAETKRCEPLGVLSRRYAQGRCELIESGLADLVCVVDDPGTRIMLGPIPRDNSDPLKVADELKLVTRNGLDYQAPAPVGSRR